MRGLDNVTAAIVDASFQIHRDPGPGLLESVYEAVLARALTRRGLRVGRQKAVRFEYDGMVFEGGFHVYLVVEDCVLAELRSVEQLARSHAKQLLTYLKLTNIPVGLLINVGAPTRRERLRRIVNGFQSSASPREPTGFQPSASSRLRVNQPCFQSSASPRLRVNQTPFSPPRLRVNQPVFSPPRPRGSA